VTPSAFIRAGGREILTAVSGFERPAARFASVGAARSRRIAPRVRDAGKEPTMKCCPVCGGELEQQKFKVVCTLCRALISNCNGD